MITYQEFFLFCTFIVALISLIYQILRDKKIAATTGNSDGLPLHKQR